MCNKIVSAADVGKFAGPGIKLISAGALTLYHTAVGGSTCRFEYESTPAQIVTDQLGCQAAQPCSAAYVTVIFGATKQLAADDGLNSQRATGKSLVALKCAKCAGSRAILVTTPAYGGSSIDGYYLWAETPKGNLISVGGGIQGGPFSSAKVIALAEYLVPRVDSAKVS